MAIIPLTERASSFLTGPETVSPPEVPVSDMLTPTPGLLCEVRQSNLFTYCVPFL